MITVFHTMITVFHTTIKFSEYQGQPCALVCKGVLRESVAGSSLPSVSNEWSFAISGLKNNQNAKTF